MIRQKIASKTLTLGVGKADLGLLKELFKKITSESAFESIKVHDCWSLSKSHVQEKAVPKYGK